MDVYGELKTVFAPQAKSDGFKRAPGGMLGWYRPRGQMHTVFWFQCSQSGWDPDSGSQFTLEFQESKEAQPGYGSRRVRFGKLLSDTEWARLPELQNHVIRQLRRSSRGHWTESLDPQTRAHFRDAFEPVKKPYSRGDDVWMRYYSADDVRRWAAFLSPILPEMVSRFEKNEIQK